MALLATVSRVLWSIRMRTNGVTSGAGFRASLNFGSGFFSIVGGLLCGNSFERASSGVLLLLTGAVLMELLVGSRGGDFAGEFFGLASATDEGSIFTEGEAART